MKSETEIHYEHFIFERILHSSLSSQEKIIHFLNFHERNREYYESLCHLLYLQAIDENIRHSLWLTLSGEPYLALNAKNADDVCIMAYSDSPLFVDDIKDHLDMVSERFVQLRAAF